MTKSSGKVFEKNIKDSIDESTYLLHRINDTAQGFQKSKFAQFTPKNPCDFMMFNPLSHYLYWFECKSTKYKSMAYDDITLDNSIKQNNMIKKHQILSLEKFSKYNHVIAGFLLNFRDEEHDCERTYFLNIKDFMRLYHKSNKKSLSEIDIIMYGAQKLNGRKKRVYYHWRIDELLENLERYEGD